MNTTKNWMTGLVLGVLTVAMNASFAEAGQRGNSRSGGSHRVSGHSRSNHQFHHASRSHNYRNYGGSKSRSYSPSYGHAHKLQNQHHKFQNHKYSNFKSQNHKHFNNHKFQQQKFYPQKFQQQKFHSQHKFHGSSSRYRYPKTSVPSYYGTPSYWQHRHFVKPLGSK